MYVFQLHIRIQKYTRKLLGVTPVGVYFLYHLYLEEIALNPDSDMGNVCLFIFGICNAIICVSTIIVMFFKQEPFLEMFYALDKVDKLMKKFQINFSYRLFHVWNAWFLFQVVMQCILLEIYYEVFEGRRFQQQFILTVGFSAAYIIRQLPIYYFFVFICFLYRRIYFINKAIVNLSSDLLSSERNGDYNRKRVLSDLSILADLLQEVSSVADNSNETFGLYILGNIVQTSLVMLLFVFTFFGLNENKRGEIGYWWGLINVLPTWVILTVTDYVTYMVRVFSCRINLYSFVFVSKYSVYMLEGILKVL